MMGVALSAMLLAVMAASPESAQRVISPEVAADGAVTFRFRAPNAKRVDVNVEGHGTLAMEKSGDVWSVRTNPLDPDLYGYTISVDGVSILDPANPAIKPNLLWPANLVLVKGGNLWETRDVPHGDVIHHRYRSKVIGDDREYFVYTPPGYRASKQALPVLYLFHGYSDTAVGWTAVGQAHVIMDNLIAEGKAKPMILVMTLGYGVPDFASPGGRGFSDRNLVLENYTKFREALVSEVIPQVERAYRTSAKRENRFVAGLSMGGAESLLCGLSRPDLFSSIGAFSSAPLPVEDYLTLFPDSKDFKKVERVWMSCGTADSLLSFQRGFSQWGKTVGLKVLAHETAGGHVWMLWRRNLADFVQLLSK